MENLGTKGFCEREVHGGRKFVCVSQCVLCVCVVCVCECVCVSECVCVCVCYVCHGMH